VTREGWALVAGVIAPIGLLLAAGLNAREGGPVEATVGYVLAGLGLTAVLVTRLLGLRNRRREAAREGHPSDAGRA
jgi:hypothetical protein